MTERKPPGARWESWVERQIHEADERGEFENLAGSGRPLPGIDDAHDELWWVKKFVRQEGLSLTPPTLGIRKAREDFLDNVATYRSERELRAAVLQLNARIRAVNRRASTGPPSTVMPLTTERVVEVWRDRRRESHCDRA
jgi:hypothetical protein